MIAVAIVLDAALAAADLGHHLAGVAMIAERDGTTGSAEDALRVSIRLEELTKSLPRASPRRRWTT